MQGHVSVANPDMEVMFSKTAQCLNVYPLLDLTSGSGFTTVPHTVWKTKSPLCRQTF